MQRSSTQSSHFHGVLPTIVSDPSVINDKEKKDDRIDVALDVSTVFLKTLKEASKFTPIAPLSQAAGVALELVVLVQKTRNNKIAFNHLVEDSCQLVSAIYEAYRYIEEENIESGLTERIHGLLNTLESIKALATKANSRNMFKALLFSGVDARKIEDYKGKLQQALRVFGLKSHISIENTQLSTARTLNSMASFLATSHHVFFSSLIDTLKNQQKPFNKLVINKAFEQMKGFLAKDDYADASLQITNSRDANNLVSFIFHLMDKKRLSMKEHKLTNRRARRFLIKVGVRMEALPVSLYLKPEDFTLSNWPSGSCGGSIRFYKAEYQYRGNFVTLKRFVDGNMGRYFRREALTWRTLSHEHVLPFLGIYQDPTEPFIALVSPFMENGTLSDWRQSCGPSVTEIEKKVLEVVKGLHYLHHEGIVHGDLSCANVFLDHDRRVKISNYDRAQHLDGTATLNSTRTFQYAAPELLSDSDDGLTRTKKTDVYAFACLYYEVHFNCLPFPTTNQPLVIHNLVTSGTRPGRLPDPPLSNKAWDVITTCWDQDPDKRRGMSTVQALMDSWSIPEDIPTSRNVTDGQSTSGESQQGALPENINQ